MWSFWKAWSVILCACSVLAQRLDQEAMMSPRSARMRDRENNMKADEPSCDQLKAMWRFSKRQARAPEIMNEVSNYHDPMAFNEWPIVTSLPRAAPRFRSQFPLLAREAYGRVLTKAPPNVVRTPDYDEMYGTLNMPHNNGKILRYSGPSRIAPHFMVPPQRYSFDTLKKIMQAEHRREMQRQRDIEWKDQKDITSGHGDDYAYGSYGQQESRGLQPLQAEYPADEPQYRQPLNRKPQAGRPISQFSRYSDVMLPPTRRNFHGYRPYPYLFVPDLNDPGLN